MKLLYHLIAKSKIFLTVCLSYIAVGNSIQAQDTNGIISVGTRESAWINDSTLFEAPTIENKDASGFHTGRITASQKLNYDFVQHNSKYYTSHDPAMIMFCLDEKGNIYDWQILKASFSRSIAEQYINREQAEYYYNPAKINGKPVKCIGIWVFEMGPQENWRSGGPIDTFHRTLSMQWSPISEPVQPE